MLNQKDFWGLEHEDSLLSHNYDYITNTPEQTHDLCVQAQSWYESVMEIAKRTNMVVPEYDPSKVITDVPEGIERIIRLDVHRTLRSEEYKKPLEKFLTICWYDFQDYAQPMCLVAGFLRLVLEEPQVYQMLYVFNKSNYYIPGYWKAQAIGFATDSYTAMEIARMVTPTAATLVWQSMKFPETFCQKFFTALGIHVFPFKYQFSIIAKFCRGGRKFLVQMLCAVLHFQEDKFKMARGATDFYPLMALDPSVCDPNIYQLIVDNAEKFTLVANFDLHSLGERMYECYLKERMEKATVVDSDDEITLSSTSDDED